MSGSVDSAPSIVHGPQVQRESKQKYRRDFDGLRAIAVLAVIATHVGIMTAPGGVDVFFVLSGYLITGNILRSLSRGSFSFPDFYARRARRIFPPLAITLIAVWLFSWLILLPDEYQREGKYIAAGASFVLNFVMHHDFVTPQISDFPYFTQFPMTGHLWSLAVEEQFYLFWPLFLFAIWKLRKRAFLPITLVAVASYILFVSIWAWDSGAAYVLPWTRMCELTFGGAVVAYQIELQNASRGYWVTVTAKWVSMLKPTNCHVQGLVGLACLVAWFAGLNSIYNWVILVPSFGTVLLVTSGPSSWVNIHLLGARPMVLVGKISYPLYLWHIPVLYITRTIYGTWFPPLQIVAGAVVLSFVLATLTYRCVELPLRSSRASHHLRVIAYSATAVMAICGAVGYMIFIQELPARSLPPAPAEYFRAAREEQASNLRPATLLALDADAPLTVGDGQRGVLFLGDSSVRQYYPRVAKLLADNPSTTRKATFAARSDCAPGAINIAEVTESARMDCNAYIKSALQYARDPCIDTVVIGARWYQYFTVPSSLGHLSASRPLKPESNVALSTLRDIISALSKSGKRVYVILSIPVGIDFDPRHMIWRTVFGEGFVVAPSTMKKAEIVSAVTPIDARIRDVARRAGATVIDPIDWLCDREACPTVDQKNRPMYQDMWNLRPSYVRDNVRFLDETVLPRGEVAERKGHAAFRCDVHPSASR